MQKFISIHSAVWMHSKPYSSKDSDLLFQVEMLSHASHTYCSSSSSCFARSVSLASSVSGKREYSQKRSYDRLTRCVQLNIAENQQESEHLKVRVCVCVTGEAMVSTQLGHALHASITED